MSALPPLRDRLRLPLAAICLGWLVYMGWDYTQLVQSRTSCIEECTTDKAACDGRKVYLALVRVLEVDEHSYRVLKLTDEHVLNGDTEGIEPGQIISVIGRFDAATDTISVEHREWHPLREWKVRLSTLGMGLSGLVLLASFTFRERRLVERDFGRG